MSRRFEARTGSASNGRRRDWRHQVRPVPCSCFDEIQKIPSWSETVKRLWDEDTRKKQPLKVVLLGSAPLLMAQGLTESLAKP